MKSNKIKGWMGALITISGVLLIAVLYVPMWYIDLDAPQYPEGLQLQIYPHKIGGNVEIINGLNHYIGMKTLHTEDFVEFTVLPYIIGFFAAAFILVGLLRYRKLTRILLGIFVIFGIIAMIDFWRWEYNYGHNLDPNAAIIVPGMAYQPPLIGFKQLLNFGAYSMPDTGGWLFVIAGAVLLLVVLIDMRKLKKLKLANTVNGIGVCFIMFFSYSCTVEKDPIVVGKDNCEYCKMTISDFKFGAELITQKGKIYKYDEAQCLVEDMKEDTKKKTDARDIYLTDFCGKHELINQKNSLFLFSEEFKSPMGGNVAVFSSPDSLKFYKQKLNAEEKTWDDISK